MGPSALFNFPVQPHPPKSRSPTKKRRLSHLTTLNSHILTAESQLIATKAHVGIEAQLLTY